MRKPSSGHATLDRSNDWGTFVSIWKSSLCSHLMTIAHEKWNITGYYTFDGHGEVCLGWLFARIICYERRSSAKCYKPLMIVITIPFSVQITFWTLRKPSLHRISSIVENLFLLCMESLGTAEMLPILCRNLVINSLCDIDLMIDSDTRCALCFRQFYQSKIINCHKGEKCAKKGELMEKKVVYTFELGTFWSFLNMKEQRRSFWGSEK